MFDPSDLSFDKEQLTSISQAIFEKGFENPTVEAIHTLVMDVKTRKQIAIMGRLNGILGKNSGECNPALNINKFKSTEKEWDPQIFSSKIPICAKDFENSLIAYSQKTGINMNDLTDTDFANWCEELVSELLLKSVLVLSWFSDTEIATLDDDGVLTNNLDEDGDSYVEYFSKIDGFWKQIFAITTADSARLTTGLDAKNAETTYADQKFNSTDRENLVVTNTLDTMVTDADLKLREMTSAGFLVTQSVFDQYKSELKFATVNFNTERLENGFEMVNIDGKKVVALPFWDRAIKEFFDNGTSYDLPHRAVYCDISNLGISVDGTDSLGALKIWYSEDDETTYIKTMYKSDAKIFIDNEIQAAF